MSNHEGPLRNSRPLSEWLRRYGFKGGARATGVPMNMDLQPVVVADDATPVVTPLPRRDGAFGAVVSGNSPTIAVVGPAPGGLELLAFGSVDSNYQVGKTATDPFAGSGNPQTVGPYAELPPRARGFSGTVILPPFLNAPFYNSGLFFENIRIRALPGEWVWLRSTATGPTTLSASLIWREFDTPVPEP